MEPQTLMRMVETQEFGIIPKKDLNKRYRLDVETIKEIGNKILMGSSSGFHTENSFQIIQSYFEAKKIYKILNGVLPRSVQWITLPILEDKIRKISQNENYNKHTEYKDGKINLGAHTFKHLKQLIIRLISKKFPEPFFEKMTVKIISCPNDFNKFIKNFLSIRIIFEQINLGLLSEFLKFCCSLIHFSEIFRDDLNDNQLLKRILLNAQENLNLKDITLDLSFDGRYCKVRFGKTLMISNSTLMGPFNRQKFCRVDSEAIENILRKKTHNSYVTTIPVLKGWDSMGIEVAKYLEVAI